MLWLAWLINMRYGLTGRGILGREICGIAQSFMGKIKCRILWLTLPTYAYRGFSSPFIKGLYMFDVDISRQRGQPTKQQANTILCTPQTLPWDLAAKLLLVVFQKSQFNPRKVDQISWISGLGRLPLVFHRGRRSIHSYPLYFLHLCRSPPTKLASSAHHLSKQSQLAVQF